MLAILPVAAVLLTGCAKTPIEVMRFDPINDTPDTKILVKNNETFISKRSKTFKVTSALFESQSIMIMPLEIVNYTGEDIQTSEYSVSLHDGRDMKQLKMLGRDELVAVKNKLEGNPGAGGFENQIINTTVNTVMGMTNLSSKEYIIKSIADAIDNYFSFRPIYTREKREGILCFIIDFKPEYPITLVVKIKDEDFYFRFMPRKIYRDPGI